MFKRMGYKDEPMPDFDSRYPGRLESCLAQPFASFGNRVFYRGLLTKAAALFYFCTKDHPFENGNKRFAVTIMLFFLLKNDTWLNLSPHVLYEFAKAVADDRHEKPADAIRILCKHLKPHLEPFNAPPQAET